MKSLGKFFVALSLLGLSITGCGPSSNADPYEKDARYTIYQLALNDGYEGTYEEWLASIKGQDGKDGQDGHTPVINIGEDGYWYIDGVNTNVKAQGPQGDKGDTGAQGPQGEQGPAGQDGVDGQNGLTAYIGSNGNWWIGDTDTGIKAQGPQGQQGEQGETGEQGPQGEQGQQGEQGPAGQDGANGQNGLSAYEIFIKYHPEYTGSEEEWINDVARNNLCNLFGHDFVDTVTPPTCTEPGYTTHTCSVCGYTFADSRTEALGHDYTNSNCCIRCGLGEASQGLAFSLSDDNEYYILSGKGTCVDTDIIVPAYYNSLPVREIDKEAFKDDVTIRNINVDITLTKIGNSAFSGCSSLQSFTFTEYLADIDDEAFASCKNLQDFVIPTSVRHIGNNAFTDCDSITTSNIPLEVYENAEIDGGTFSGCDNLTTVFIPEGTTRIPGGLAYYNDNNITYVLFGGSEAEWNNIVFGYDNDILSSAPYLIFDYSNEYHDNGTFTYLVLGNKIEGIRAKDLFIESFDFDVAFAGYEFGSFAPRAFQGCSKLASCVLPNGLTKMPKFMLSGCTMLISIIIPEGVTIIENDVFAGDNNLESVSFPSTLTAIRNNAFWTCGKLRSVVLPASLVYLGDQTFGGCNNDFDMILNGRLTHFGSEVFYVMYGVNVYVNEADYDYYVNFNNSEWQSGIVQENRLHTI